MSRPLPRRHVPRLRLLTLAAVLAGSVLASALPLTTVSSSALAAETTTQTAEDRQPSILMWMGTPGYRPGSSVRLTVMVADYSKPDPQADGGTMTFDLGSVGTGQCIDLPLDEFGRAHCFATFQGDDTKFIAVSFSGTSWLAPSSKIINVVSGERHLLRAALFPESTPDWQDGTYPHPIDFSGMPAGPFLHVAASHNGEAVALVDANENLYVGRTDQQAGFELMRDYGGNPMKARGVGIDIDPRNGETQLIVIGGESQLYHSTRPRNGSWSRWGIVSNGFVARDVAISIDGAGRAHFAASGLDGNANYRVRYPDGSWDSWWDLVRPGGAGDPVKADQIAISAAIPGAVDLAVSRPRSGSIRESLSVSVVSKRWGWAWTDPTTVVPSAWPADIAIGRRDVILPDGHSRSDVLVAVANGLDIDWGMERGGVVRALREDETWHPHTRYWGYTGGVMTEVYRWNQTLAVTNLEDASLDVLAYGVLTEDLRN